MHGKAENLKLNGSDAGRLYEHSHPAVEEKEKVLKIKVEILCHPVHATVHHS